MATPAETELHTERLVLRPLNASDTLAIQRYVSDRRVAQFTSYIPHPYPDGAAEWFIADTVRREQSDEIRRFAIALAEDPSALIGTIELKDRGSDQVEIGYWLGVPFWGSGLMSEAVAATADFARRWRPAATVSALTHPDNTASQRVLEKAGFQRRGAGVCEAPARDYGRIDNAPLFVFDPAKAA